jgi:predicted CoA-binding protein
MSKKTLVLGASPNEARYSNMAIRRLRQQNIEVEAFGLRKGVVSDVTIDTERKAYENLDTITLYMNPKNQKAYYDYILSLHPKRVIFNPGTENAELSSLLEQNGIKTEVACTLVLLSMNRY